MRVAVLLIALAGCESTSVSDSLVCGGIPCQAIYVASAGDDGAAGTKAQPLRTIGVGIVHASLGTPKKAVFVQAGVYAESIVMSAGVGIYGRFDGSWQRDPALMTELVGTSPVVLFGEITVATVLDGITVRSEDGVGPGASSYAVGRQQWW